VKDDETQNRQRVCCHHRDNFRATCERVVFFATTKGLSQIVTPDSQPEGDLSLSFQIQDKRIANPYQLQAELGLTEWGEVAVFRDFAARRMDLGTEIGLLRKEPYLLSIGFINWSPHLDEDPQPFIEAGYWGEHHRVCVGAIHAGYKNESILGYAMISMRGGGYRSIGKGVLKTHRRSGSPATSRAISNSIRPCTSVIVRTTI